MRYNLPSLFRGKFQEFAEPAKSETADGTGKPVSDAPREVTMRKRPSKAYDAIHDRTSRSAQPLLPPEQVKLVLINGCSFTYGFSHCS